MSRFFWSCCLPLSLVSVVTQASEPPLTTLTPTYSDWGTQGILQTPTARLSEAGAFNVTMSQTEPYTRLSVLVQPFDWLEAGFRYVEIGNRDFGPSISNRDLQDKSLDVKVRLLQESRWLPEITTGMRDIGGTGLFSSEYVVATKRWYDIEASIGLATGNLGARGDLNNPLRVVGDRFRQRKAANTSGNQVGSFGNVAYTGPVGVIGGLVWRPQAGPWALKLELDGNDYRSEPSNNPQPTDSPINAGLSWRITPGVELGASWQRGNTLGLAVTVDGNFARLRSVPKTRGPRPEPVAPAPLQAAPLEEVVSALRRQSGLVVTRVQQATDRVRIEAEQNADHQPARAIAEAARVLHNRYPESVQSFTVGVQSAGMPVVDYDITRSVALDQLSRPPRLSEPFAVIQPATPRPLSRASDTPLDYQRPGFETGGSFSAGYRQNVGGPDAFLLYDVSAVANGFVRWGDHTYVLAEGRHRVLDNYDRFRFDGPSNLPRVRTDIRRYLTSSRTTVPVLQMIHVRPIGSDWFASGYVGALEMMYAGVGGELLYRPLNSRVAIGVDVNHVRQRGFEQDAELRDYRVTTGHLSTYFSTGFEGVTGIVRAGRYLAGDVGVTFEAFRSFRNGVRMGAYATFTDVSAEEFGEGDFDKGLYVKLPLDLVLPIRTRGQADLDYSPLTRDGGARLSRRWHLYDLTTDRQSDLLYGNRALVRP